MVTTKAVTQRAFAQEIAELEAEMSRVIALKITSTPARADLVERMARVKAKAAMLCN